MIDVFRKEFDRLSDGEKKHEQMINSLKRPCQILLLSTPDKKSHLLIKSHLNEWPDKTIRTIFLDSVRYIEQIEELHKNMSTTEDEPQKFGKIIIPPEFSQSLKNQLVQFGKSIMQRRADASFNGFGGMSLINNNLAVWYLYGNIESIDFAGQGKKIVNEYKQAYLQSEKEKSTQKPEQIRQYDPTRKQGYGTFCFPAVLIGNFNPSIREQIENREYQLLEQNVLTSDFDGTLVIVTKEGLIGMQTKDIKIADEILHTITSTALLMGIPLHAHKSSELAELSIEVSTNKISGSSWSESSLRMQLFDMVARYDPFRRTRVRLQISVEDFERLVEEAKKIWKTKIHLDNLKLLSGAFTYLQNNEFSQSFILSWTLIEKHLYDLWNKKLQQAKISNNRIRQLNSWDVSRILEILHIDKIISDDDYFDITSLRGLRNNLFHDGQEITQKQAQNCFELVFGLISRNIGISIKIKTNHVMMI